MDPIKDRISKLLSMATSVNENEASLALAHAQRLMADHQISLSELEVEASEDIIQDQEPVISSGRIPNWKAVLVNFIATNNGCTIVKQTHQGASRGGRRGSNLVIFGKQDDIAAVRFMSAYAILQLSRLAPKSMGRKQYKSWYFGAVKGLIDRMLLAKTAAFAKHPKALVKIDTHTKKVSEFSSEALGNVKKSAPIQCDLDLDQYHAGLQVGASVDINDKSQLSEHTTPTLT